jgi:UDP-N-acetylglucosamine 2-epimerase (non-hydrolysing)
VALFCADDEECGVALKVMAVFGTRPEAIKLAPVIDELKKRDGVETRVVITAQHREMIDQALSIFNIVPDIDLDIMRPDQTLDGIVCRSMAGIAPVFDAAPPDIVLVQGDTTSAMAMALAANHRGIKVGHVEAGLRTYDKTQPFPEELNRQLIGRLADLHFAPTETARENLRREGTPSDTVFMTGNTVVDALLRISAELKQPGNKTLQEIDFDGRRVILVTAHRRESFGAPLKNIAAAVRQIAEENADVEIVLPVHPNPRVSSTLRPALEDVARIHLVEPLDYPDLVWTLSKCYFAMTDSGGIQEEAPTFKKPVLVMREKTERPEGVEAGVAKIVGTTVYRLVGAATDLLTNDEVYSRMRAQKNPYGDGRSAQRIADILLKL